MSIGYIGFYDEDNPKGVSFTKTKGETLIEFDSKEGLPEYFSFMLDNNDLIKLKTWIDFNLKNEQMYFSD